MNLFTLSWAYIRNRKLNTFLNTLLLALGVGIVVYLLLITTQLQNKMQANAKDINLVVGAKGSPLQLILCSIFHIDNPTGNIKLSDANKIASNKRFVKNAIPLALGDSYQAFRIVGTNQLYPEHYSCQLANGKWWRNVMEATIGSEVARQSGLKVGDTFHSSHGLDGSEDNQHEEQSYKVVGIMKPSETVMDRLVLTSIESVWAIHEHHEATAMPVIPIGPSTKHTEEHHDTTSQEDDREITALLLTFSNPMATLMMPRMINSQSNLQAASPAMEIVRLFDLFGVGADVIEYFAYVIILIAGLSIFIALYNALKERQYDLAIMRTLGASQNKLFTHIILEGLLLAAFGGICGLLLGHGAVELTSALLDQTSQVSFKGWQFLTGEYYIFAGVLGVGLIASLLPALQTYRIDISETLAT
ncbi:ABC transporter permease [Cytophagaceae bacterium DM2B3-1]|uniref:ABC transporter permease n=1 Tax=Xanthocytophaga flava TaxID=3048013 RepID=A0ABT7CE73_9BACT|nr:FtsX-like permease family protein [Xanthocytophaga flavus]MDJ1491362.1 ABC transporter permease [Xanthocytophaga flavus]